TVSGTSSRRLVCSKCSLSFKPRASRRCPTSDHRLPTSLIPRPFLVVLPVCPCLALVDTGEILENCAGGRRERGSRAPPIGGFLGDRTLHNGANRPGQIGRQRSRLVGRDAEGEIDEAFSVERCVSGQAVVRDDAEGVKVGQRSGYVAHDLLRRRE